MQLECYIYIFFHPVQVGFPNEVTMLDSLEKECQGTIYEKRLCKVLGCVLFTNVVDENNSLPMDTMYTVRVFSEGEVAKTDTLFSRRKSKLPRAFEHDGEWIFVRQYLSDAKHPNRNY